MLNLKLSQTWSFLRKLDDEKSVQNIKPNVKANVVANRIVSITRVSSDISSGPNMPGNLLNAIEQAKIIAFVLNTRKLATNCLFKCLL